MVLLSVALLIMIVLFLCVFKRSAASDFTF
jgi:hypothetical protein